MKKWESQLLRHILNEKYLGEEDTPKMDKNERSQFLEAVSNYQRLGEMIYRKNTLREVSQTLGKIAKQAEQLTISESEHWFDNVTVSRHMKQMNEAYKVFEKTANEMSGLQQRLESAYEDMGTILNRYYKVNGALQEDQYTAGADDDGPAIEEDQYTAGVDDAGTALEEDQYTAGVSDYGPAFHDHMTSTNSKRLKESIKARRKASKITSKRTK